MRRRSGSNPTCDPRPGPALACRSPEKDRHLRRSLLCLHKLARARRDTSHERVTLDARRPTPQLTEDYRASRYAQRMRTGIAICLTLLLLIVAGGFGVSGWVMVTAISQASEQHGGGAAALLAGVAFSAIPFIVGTMALVGFSIVIAIGASRDEMIAAIRGVRN